MSHRGLVGRAMTASAVLLVAGGCSTSTSTSGSDVASDTVDQVVDAYVDRLDRMSRTSTSGRDLAATLDALEEGSYSTGQGGGGTVTIDPLTWSGSSGDEDGAVVEARISVSVPEYDSSDWSGLSYDAGDAVECVRFVVKLSDRRTDTDRFDCPGTPPPAAPTYEPRPEVPGDAQARMKKVLASATPASLEADVRAAFDRELVTQTAVDAGRYVATVGVSGTDDCLVAVREPDGRVTFPSGFPREWLMPGELGCSPQLVTAPPV